MSSDIIQYQGKDCESEDIMKRCKACGGVMEQREQTSLEGLEYSYFRCRKCGEHILDIKQLDDIGEKYRILMRDRSKTAKGRRSLY